ncbi:MAG: recombination mediator RecR [Alphaproteobacteria bacterium]|nr:recombination mediator RecR [Alphaproteobacteria bacterium]
MVSNEIKDLISALGKIHGFGNRAATRATLHLIANKDAKLLPLIDALSKVASNITKCACGNYDTKSPCSICADKGRNERELCIVPDISSLWAIERGGFYRGKYHILGGILSAINGIEPKDLNLATLPDRVAEVAEVILALPSTMEANITANYISQILKPTGVNITELAHGIPMGGELDYLDPQTLEAAITHRKKV